jgi:cation diffusion facilitator family transporter
MDQMLRQIRNVTWIGLTTNIMLSLAKLAGGILGSSHAVVADGVHSLSDTATDLAILIGVRFWTAPPDDNHPHGHHRIETLITSIIGVILGGVAIGVFVDAITTLRNPSGTPPSWLAFGVAVGSIVIKEMLYRYTIREGKRLNSNAVIANAWHQRSDMLSSIPAATAVLGTKFLPDWRILDSVGAIIVSLLILRAAFQIVSPALAQLVDTGAGPEVRERIKTLSLEIPGVLHVHAVRTRYMGSGLTVDMHIEVDGHMSVKDGHTLSVQVKRHLIEKGPDIMDVFVHLEPEGDHLQNDNYSTPPFPK